MDEQTATPKARTMEFSTRLKDLRAQSALSQEQLARRIGVSRQAITK
ncbi:helix-turn-helix transcriptional regulator [Bifidobacterium pseudolongum]|nr:helix-turn-helix domain-containing protein [Bifidobacterium pseudolongum]